MFGFISDLWNSFVFEPLFNLIAALMALIPGHNFAISLIVFTILIRIALYPIIKKQLSAIKKQRILQPEINKLKKTHKTNKQKQHLEIMALYKRNNFNPFAMLLYLAIQLPILIALYQIINRIAANTQSLVTDTYAFIQNLPWVQELALQPDIFDPSLFGLVDLTRSSFSEEGFYINAFLVVVAAAFSQFLVSKQSFTQNGSSKQKGWKEIFREISSGKEPDSSEISGAATRLMIYIFPIIILIIFPRWSAALSFYIFLTSITQYLQQKHINSQDDQGAVKVAIDGQDEMASVSKPLNAKQKKEQAARSAGSRRPRAKRVTATAKTIKKGEKF